MRNSLFTILSYIRMILNFFLLVLKVQKEPIILFILSTIHDCELEMIRFSINMQYAFINPIGDKIIKYKGF